MEAEKARTDVERQKAETAEANTLADYRASTDDAVEQLIGSKLVMGPQEKALEKTLKRWQSFADRQGGRRSRAGIPFGQRGISVLAYLGQTRPQGKGSN